MLVLITSLTSETRVSLDPERVRAVAARCGKPMTVWTYTLPSPRSDASRRRDAGCSCTATCAMSASRWARLAGYAEALAASAAARLDMSARRPLPDGLPPRADGVSGEASAGAHVLPDCARTSGDVGDGSC